MLRRFHIDVDNGRETIRDDEDVAAGNPEQALADARGVIGEMADDLDTAELNSPWMFVARDEMGLAVARMPIGAIPSSHRMPRRR